tara:strand:+ start:167 stop:457 length:291 start_codon:yes stop_codon:yes gene_type:complete
VSAPHAVAVEIRMYDRLFLIENLNKIEDDFKNHLNPDSLTINTQALLEPSARDAQVGDQFQFERIGYFRVDEDSHSEKLIFNRTLTLRDGWTKKNK